MNENKILELYGDIIKQAVNKKVTGDVLMSLVFYKVDYIDKKFFCTVINELNPNEMANDNAMGTCLAFLVQTRFLIPHIKDIDLVCLSLKKIQQIILPYIKFKELNLSHIKVAILKAVIKYLDLVTGKLKRKGNIKFFGFYNLKLFTVHGTKHTYSVFIYF